MRTFPATLPIKYLYTLTAHIKQTHIGDIEGGYRVDFDYVPNGGSPPGADQTLSVISGSDRVFVSDDGFVDFQTRITVSLPDAKGVYLGGVAIGRADLRDCCDSADKTLFKDADTNDTVVGRWKSGLGAGSYLPLLLGVTFDIPTQGSDPTLDPAYDKVRKAGIGRRLLVGVGFIICGNSDESVVLHIGKVAV